MITRYLLLLLLGASSLMAKEVAITTQNDEEALFLRRIAQFYEEKEYQIVQKEISQYLEQYSESSFWYQLHGFLGDLYLNQGQYDLAIDAYTKVKDVTLQKDFTLNYLMALYKSGKHDALIKVGKDLFQKDLYANEDKLFFFMGSSLYEIVLNEGDIAKRNAYALEAKEHLNKVRDEQYLLNAKERLAHISSMLKDEEGAALVYFDLAASYPEHKERFMFQAAIMESSFDQEKALESFQEISHMQGVFASEAALNRMILLFDMEKYAEVLLIQDQLFELLEEKHHPFLHYFIGKSNFLLEDYSRASESLGRYISFDQDKGAEEKSALLLMLSTADKLEDVDAYSKTLSLFTMKFPEDPQVMKAQLVRALLYKKNQDNIAALKEFHLLEASSLKEDRDLYFYEYALLLLDMGEKKKSYELFSKLVKEFPESNYLKEAWQHVVNLSTDLYKETSFENQTQLKWQLISDLKAVVACEKVFDSKEKLAEYHFLLASHLYDVKEFALAKEYLTPIIDQIGDLSLKAKGLLMLAWIAHREGSSPELFCQYGTEALALSEDLALSVDLHLALYNAYLSQAKDDNNLLLEAANHLNRVYKIDRSKISEDNLLWLVQYYHDQITNNVSVSENLIKDSLVLYADVIGKMHENKTMEEKPRFYESHVLQFVDVLTVADETERKIQFLESLSAQYDYLADNEWMNQPRTYFELAKAYQLIDNDDMAKENYEKVFRAPNKSLLKAESMLEHSRLTLSHISKEDFGPTNPDIRMALGRLKSVALQKNVQTEPVHLQAALEAIDLQCACEKQMTPEKHVFLLDKLFENFTTQEDILSRAYHESLGSDGSKQKMFDVYLSLIEAEKDFWQAKVEKETSEKAKESLMSISEKHDQISSYILERIDQKIQSLSDGVRQ